MRQNEWSLNLAAAHFALQIVFLLICIISINANPLQPGETSAENPKQMTKLPSQVSSDESSNSASRARESAEENVKQSKPNTSDDMTSITIPGPFSYLSEYQWQKLTTPNRPLITEVAFNLGQRPSPSYAWIGSDSYNKYLEYLEHLCRTREEEDIAEVNLDTLDSDYFRWEEIQFNRALIKQIFPETAQGDQRRYLNATQTLRRMHLRAEAPSECQAETVEDTWSDRANERSQFEDFIINTIFRPHFDAVYTNQIINDDFEVEIERQYDDANSIAATNSVDEEQRVRRDAANELRHAKRMARQQVNLYRAQHKLR
ncbi:hypothetical protein M3Y94_01203600 [Aphelenchoides besseyi]|nr:hypothetical protein M3Y94_01203600 [Aphelenchoides besseyi]